MSDRSRIACVALCLSSFHLLRWLSGTPLSVCVSVRVSVCPCVSYCSCLEHVDNYLLYVARDAEHGVPPRLVLIDELLPPAQRAAGRDVDWKEGWAKSLTHSLTHPLVYQCQPASQPCPNHTWPATASAAGTFARSPCAGCCVLGAVLSAPRVCQAALHAVSVECGGGTVVSWQPQRRYQRTSHQPLETAQSDSLSHVACLLACLSACLLCGVVALCAVLCVLCWFLVRVESCGCVSSLVARSGRVSVVGVSVRGRCERPLLEQRVAASALRPGRTGGAVLPRAAHRHRQCAAAITQPRCRAAAARRGQCSSACAVHCSPPRHRMLSVPIQRGLEKQRAVATHTSATTSHTHCTASVRAVEPEGRGGGRGREVDGRCSGCGQLVSGAVDCTMLCEAGSSNADREMSVEAAGTTVAQMVNATRSGKQ